MMMKQQQGIKTERNTSYQDIRGHIEDLYGIALSNGTLNAVTDKLLPELKAWRERDLEAIYPIVWLDAIHYKVRENGRYVSNGEAREATAKLGTYMDASQ